MVGFTNSLPEIIWFVVGLVMILMEFAVPGVVLVFFGIGAWVVTVFTYLKIVTSLTGQLFLFSVASLTLLAVLRRWVRDKFYGHVSGSQDLMHNLDEFTGHRVEVLKDVVPERADGQVEFKGATWTAVADEEIRQGETATIVRRDGLTLVIKK